MALVPEESVDLVKRSVLDMVHLEEQLEYLRTLPFIQVHPNDVNLQRATPASKLYKEYLQQYINLIKMVEYVIYKDKRLDAEEAEESPLRSWFKEHGTKN